MPRFRRLFRFPWRTNQQIDKDLDAEVQFHLEMRTEELIDHGVAPAAAREQARRGFGDIEETRQYCRPLDQRAERQARWQMVLDEFRQDVRYGARSLVKSPGFTAAAVLTLALGIGSTTAIFSVVSGVLMRPLPYRDADRIQRIWENTVDSGSQFSVSDGAFLHWREENSTLEDLASFTTTTRTLYGGDAPDRVRVGLTSWNFFQFLGVSPLIGRPFAPDEDMPGAAVAIIDHAMWSERFGADPNIIGRALALNDRTHTVIGVLPPDAIQLGNAPPCRAPCDVRIWAPRNFDRSRQGMYHGVLARPKPGATTAAVAADLGRIAVEHGHTPSWEDEPWRSVTAGRFGSGTLPFVPHSAPVEGVLRSSCSPKRWC